MNIDKKRVGAIASAFVAVGVIVGGTVGIASAVSPADPEPTNDRQRSTSIVVDETPEPTVTPTETPTPEPVVEEPVVEPDVVEPAAPAPVAPVAPAPAPVAPAAPAPPVVAPPAPEPPAPAPPVRCPGGSSSVESDGYNDLACMPNTAPNGGSCFEGDNGMLAECQSFRP